MLDVRRIFLYNILPKKRLLIALIGFIISATIISGGGLLISNIFQATAEYFGTSEDVVVISNPSASTPYTSILPLELAEAVSSVPGVLTTSPEVMTAAVFENKAVYLRGVDIHSFWEFTDIVELHGELISDNDVNKVTVGVNFAERFSLHIGDRITIFSTRSDKMLEVAIKSIVKTKTLLDDEIIAPLWIGQFFSFQTYNYITHIRAKIDLNIISKEDLINLVSSEFSVYIKINTPQEINELNGTCYVRSISGKVVKKIIFTNVNELTVALPFGKYEFQVAVGGIYSVPMKILVDHNNTRVPLFLNYIERELEFHVITDINEPIANALINLRLREGDIVRSTYEAVSDENGYAKLTVPNGTYYIRVSYENYIKSFDYTTNETNNIEVVLIQRRPQIAIYSPVNGSTVFGQNKIMLNATVSTGYWLYYYIDGDTATTREFISGAHSELAPRKIFVDLAPGYHSITFYAKNSDYDGNKSVNYAEKTVFFNLIDELDPNTIFNGIVNGSKLYPNSMLTLNSTLFFSYDLKYSWNNETWYSLDNDIIPVPSLIGIHKLYIALQGTQNSFDFLWVFQFVITENTTNGGLVNLPPSMVVRSGKELHCWYSENVSAIYYKWDEESDKQFIFSNKITVPSLNDGKHNLTLSLLLKDEQWVNRTYEFIIDNTVPDIYTNFENGTTIDFSQNLSIYSNEELAEMWVAWDNYNFSRIYDGIVPPLLKNGWHNLTVVVKDIAGNVNKSTLFFNISKNGAPELNFFLNYEYSGIINTTYILLNVYSANTLKYVHYRIAGPVTKEGNYTSPQKIYLYPGSYTLFITCWDNNGHNLTRTWSFEINDGFNSSNLDTKTIFGDYSIDWAYVPDFDYYLPLTNDTIFFADGMYTLIFKENTANSTKTEILQIDTIPPEITILSPYKGQNQLIVTPSIKTNAVDVYYKLDDESNYTLYRPMPLSFNETSSHTITFKLIDSFGNVNEVSYDFIVGLEYSSVTFNITHIGLNETQIANVTVGIYTYLNNTLTYLQTDTNGMIYCQMLPSSFIISFDYLGENYVYSFETLDKDYYHIVVGNSNVTFYLYDEFTGEEIKNEVFAIRYENGHTVQYLRTDNQGITTTELHVGYYYCHFYRESGIIVKGFQVYAAQQVVTFNILSKDRIFTIEFEYENGTKGYNLPVEIYTNTGVNMTANTGISGSVSFLSANGIANITVSLTDGKQLTFQRYLLSDESTIVIVLPSESETQWQNIPFNSIGGNFAIMITLSADYFNHYLRGSLLLTYTLLYTEISLIILVVVINLHTILRSVFIESRREITILKLIGSTFKHLTQTVFIRLAILTVFGGIIGYWIGSMALKLLAANNQTVFFGHTFIINNDWKILLVCVVILLLASIISSTIIGYKEYQRSQVSLAKK